jgi:hypothetical protein
VTEDGRLDLDRLDLWRATLAKHAGHRVVLELRKKGERRSGKSNRHYFGAVIRHLAQEWGYADAADLHDALGHKFRPLPPDPITGAPRRMRTRDMDQDQFSAYVREIVLWAETEMGVSLEGVDL